MNEDKFIEEMGPSCQDAGECEFDQDEQAVQDREEGNFEGISLKQGFTPNEEKRARILARANASRDAIVKARAGNGETRLRILSMGWGIQSWFLAAASARGEYGLEKLDYAFHADTGYEQEATYAFARKWTPYLENAGIKLEVVKDQGVIEMMADPENGSTFMPLYTKDDETGKKGILNRACTERLKIRPIRRRLNEILVSPEVHSGRKDNRVEQWLGISWDEFHRAKSSSVRYIVARHPLIELKLTRQDCINKLLEWFGQEGVPPKSSCVMCPYHNPKGWWDLIERGGPDLETAIRIDEANRNKRPGYTVFVNPKLIPLRELAKEAKQGAMF